MRQPQNVHVYPYRRSADGVFEYAVFQRADDPKCWQGICGGVEAGETPEQAARRESSKEAGITGQLPFYRLDTISSLPSDIFAAHKDWGNDVLICPMLFFAVPYDGEITLSSEHTQMRWLPYPDAFALIYWHDQKTALWELSQRLLRGNLIR